MRRSSWTSVAEAAPAFLSQLGRKAKKIAPLGYLSKGILYLLLGLLAVEASLRPGEELEGAMGVIRTVDSQPLGTALVAALLLGLGVYAFWQMVRSIADPEGRAKGAHGVAFRVVTFAVGVAYGTLVWKGLGVLGEDLDPRDSDSLVESLSTTLQNPLYRIGVVAVGVGILLFGLSEIVRAIRVDSERDEHPWLGRLGHLTRGLISGLTGWFIVRGAITYAPREFRSLREVLREVRDQPFGRPLLFGLALGLISYGLLQLARARSLNRYGAG